MAFAPASKFAPEVHNFHRPFIERSSVGHPSKSRGPFALFSYLITEGGSREEIPGCPEPWSFHQRQTTTISRHQWGHCQVDVRCSLDCGALISSSTLASGLKASRPQHSSLFKSWQTVELQQEHKHMKYGAPNQI